MASVYLDHIISRITDDISFLRSQNLISPADAALITSLLPSPGASATSPVAPPVIFTPPEPAPATPVSFPVPRSLPSRPPSAQPPAPPPQARALWAYNSNDPDDLVFGTGDVINIVEETSADWWKGRLNGREGMFPSNYVEKIAAPPTNFRTPSPSPSPMNFRHPSIQPMPYPPPSSMPAQNFTSPPAYTSTRAPPPNANNYEKQPYYPASPVPQPPQQQWQGPSTPAPPPPQAPAQDPKKPRLGKYGSQLATAAVGGLGFGAGAALGSDIINSIF